MDPSGRVGRRGAPNVDALAEPVGQVVGADVQLGVAEAIDPQHLGDHGVVVGLRQRHDTRQQQVGVDRLAELAEVDAVAELCGGRREDVAPGERGAGRRQVPAGVGQLDGTFRPARHRHRRGEQTVVGADEDALAAGDLDGDRAA